MKQRFPFLSPTRTLMRILGCITILFSLFSASIPARAQINTDMVLNVGRNAMYFEDYVLSIQYFNQAINAKPYLAKPYLFRAIAKLNLEDYAGAEKDASLAIERNPFIADAWEVRGVARQNRGDNTGAAADYEEALKLLPHNRQISYNLAAAQTEEGKYDKADSTYQSLLKAYPGFENGYLGRARLNLLRGDTIAATNDIDKALSINNNSFNAHAMKADLALRGSEANIDSAFSHLNAAIKLQPRIAGLYVNRAYLNYKRDDWFAAMSDYDYALELDPLNPLALFNRGLLEMEVNAQDRALEDFNKVLQIDPDDIRAIYNRAVIYSAKNDYKKALADVNRVVERFPDFPTGYLMRSEIYRNMGNREHAMADYDRGRALSRKVTAENLPGRDDLVSGNSGSTQKPEDAKNDGQEISQAERTLAKRQFASLLTVDDNTDFREEYNNSAIRGRIQDRNVAISPMSNMELTFYASPTELRRDTYYIKEIDDLNNTRMLRMAIFVTTDAPQLNDPEMIDRHFKSIDYYNSYIATHAPRTVDYFGRALDFVTVHNYDAAISDLNNAISLTPDYAPAYFLRAQARLRKMEGDEHKQDEEGYLRQQIEKKNILHRRQLQDALDDLDKTISLSPLNALAYYNRANVLMQMGREDEAEQAYNRAIELRPDLAEAYFNRGYLRLNTGRRDAGMQDLSRAGELGLPGAYNILKRMASR